MSPEGFQSAHLTILTILTSHISRYKDKIPYIRITSMPPLSEKCECSGISVQYCVFSQSKFEDVKQMFDAVDLGMQPTTSQ